MNLLKKAKRFKWDKECEDDFQALKIEKDDYTQQTKRGVNWFSKQNVLLKIELQKKLLYRSYDKHIYESNIINT